MNKNRGASFVSNANQSSRSTDATRRDDARGPAVPRLAVASDPRRRSALCEAAASRRTSALAPAWALAPACSSLLDRQSDDPRIRPAQPASASFACRRKEARASLRTRNDGDHRLSIGASYHCAVAGGKAARYGREGDVQGSHETGTDRETIWSVARPTRFPTLERIRGRASAVGTSRECHGHGAQGLPQRQILALALDGPAMGRHHAGSCQGLPSIEGLQASAGSSRCSRKARPTVAFRRGACSNRRCVNFNAQRTLREFQQTAGHPLGMLAGVLQ